MVSYSEVVIINSLHVIQSFLGDIESWPSKIIKLIFIDEYNRQNLYETAIFFYGNNVPLDVALSFYSQCNEHSRLMHFFHFTLLYSSLKRPDSSTCECTYYETKHKRLGKFTPRILNHRQKKYR
jgi:hypothetical protein